MIREFLCACGHVSEKIFQTFAQDAKTKTVRCSECGKTARRVDISVTGRPNLVAGCGGFYSPSQSK